MVTEVREERARSLVVRNRDPDAPFELSVNPYRGCEHGCIYCYARANHGYVGLSAGLDFETRLFAKTDAAGLLAGELASRAWRCAPISVGTATDAYQPIERRYGLTRALIGVMAQFRQPFSILTKSSLVERDLDLLAPLARDGLASVHVTLTTLDEALARRWEPRAAAPWRRLETMRRLREAGIPVGVAVAPVVPFLNEPELEQVLTEARAAGAQTAFYQPLRLPPELHGVFADWLRAHYPQRAQRVLRHVDDLQRGSGQRGGRHAWAELIRLRFEIVARKLGFDRDPPALRTDLFRRPGDEPRQPELF